MSTQPRDEETSRYGRILTNVRDSLRVMQEAGETITFYAVAKKAQVSRSTLYRRDDLRRLVVMAREGAPIPPAPHTPLQAESPHQPSNPSISRHSREISDLTMRIAALQEEVDLLESLLRLAAQASTTPANQRCTYALITLSAVA